MNELLINGWELLMILTFTTCTVVWLMDTHMDDQLKVKDPSRFVAALLVLVCLYSLYIAALSKKTNEGKRYQEKNLTGITINV